MTTSAETHRTVVLLNDDKTPMEFVVYLLQTVFDRTRDDAALIMMTIHQQGEGVCGTYPTEVADAMLVAAQKIIADAGFPLAIRIEPITYVPLMSGTPPPSDDARLSRNARLLWLLVVIGLAIAWFGRR